MESENLTTTESENKSVEQNKETETVDVDALKADFERMKSTNERLLAESKEYKQKYGSLKSTVEKQTKEKLEKEEDWKGLLEQERSTSQSISDQFLKLKKQTLRKTLDFEVAKHAKDAYEIEDIINSLDRDAIKIDEETLQISGVEDAVNSLRAKKSYLFNNKKNASMVEERPGFNKPAKKDLNKLNINESVTTLRDLFKENMR